MTRIDPSPIPALIAAVCALMLTGCSRSLPPEVLEFKPPPPKIVEKPSADLAVAVTSSAPAEPPPPAPPVAPPSTSAPAPPAPAPAPAAPTPEPAAKPMSLVGSWKLAEMSHQGQKMPMPDGMSLTMTFTESGSVTMSMTGAPEGAGQDQQGTYTVDGSQITITLGGETKSGTITFESENRVVLDVQEAQMVLTR